MKEQRTIPVYTLVIFVCMVILLVFSNFIRPEPAFKTQLYTARIALLVASSLMGVFLLLSYVGKW